MLNSEDAVALYSSTIEMPVDLVGPLSGGETGATEIRLGTGQRQVLKWESDERNKTARRTGVALTRRLRAEAGWPVPKQQLCEADGVLFVAQEFMSGSEVTELTHPFIDDFFALHERRLGLAVGGDPLAWGRGQIEILTSGGRGYCLHEPLHDYDARTRRIARRIEEIGRTLEPQQLQGTDIVHADMHPGNMLQIGGRLSAVVDLDYASAGDASFDLVFLAVSSLSTPYEAGVRRRLFEAVRTSVDEPRRLAYVGNLLLRLLDWPIRKGRTDEIEFWLQHADRLFEPT